MVTVTLIWFILSKTAGALSLINFNLLTFALSYWFTHSYSSHLCSCFFVQSVSRIFMIRVQIYLKNFKSIDQKVFLQILSSDFEFFADKLQRLFAGILFFSNNLKFLYIFQESLKKIQPNNKNIYRDIHTQISELVTSKNLSK